MLLLNFSHPLRPAHLSQLADELGEKPVLRFNHMAQASHEDEFAEQVKRLVDSVNLSPTDWQTERILVNPPGFTPLALVLLAELHGRMGYFPAIVRMRPISNSTPPEYEVAEVINLQAVRDQARRERVEKEV